MNAQTLDGSRAASSGPLAEPTVVQSKSEDQLAADAEREGVASSGRSFWRVAIIVVVLVAGGFVAFAMMQKHQTENRLFAPVTVPVAVADAQVAANKAKAAAAAARKSASSVQSKVAARTPPSSPSAPQPAE